MKREYPPYVSYLFVAVLSVAQVAMQVTLPFKLQQLTPHISAVGFLITWNSFWYVISGLFLNRMTHHISPRRVLLVTLSICTATTLAMPFTQTVWQLYAMTTAYFMSVCLCWAAAEHASSGLHSQLNMMQSTSIYCVSFSVGNAFGTLASLYLQSQTVTTPFLVSVALTVVTMAMVWVTVAHHTSAHETNDSTPSAPAKNLHPQLPRSLLAARIGLVGAYGTYALILIFLPRYLVDEHKFSKPLTGNLTCLVLFAMAAAFGLHGLWTRWPHKLAFARIAPFVAAVGTLVVCATTRPWVIALGVIIVGAAAATAYTHNLYYSLEDPTKRARNAAIHEALVGAAFLVPPLMSGLTTRFVTSNAQSIFWVGAALAVAFGIAQNLALFFSPNPKAETNESSRSTSHASVR